ncbi:MAG: hypothetical protein WD045_02980 [Pirellulaceae bacterium]
MRNSSLTLLLGLLLLGGLGCGDDRGSGRSVTPPPPDAKVTLEEIAETGTLGDLKDKLRAQIEAMSEAQPEKAEELMTDYQQLVSQSSADDIRAKAQAMAEKL